MDQKHKRRFEDMLYTCFIYHNQSLVLHGVLLHIQEPTRYICHACRFTFISSVLSVLSETLVQGGLVKGHNATFVMEKSQHK